MRLLELFPIEKKEKKKDRGMKRGEDSQREKGKRGEERRGERRWRRERERERTRTILGIEVYKAKNNISPFVILFGDTMINISIIKLQI